MTVVSNADVVFYTEKGLTEAQMKDQRVEEIRKEVFCEHPDACFYIGKNDAKYLLQKLDEAREELIGYAELKAVQYHNNNLYHTQCERIQQLERVAEAARKLRPLMVYEWKELDEALKDSGYGG